MIQSMRTSIATPGHHQGAMHPQHISTRGRIYSDEVKSGLSPLKIPQASTSEQWKNTDYATQEERLIALIEFINEDKDNQSQLIGDF